jgi:hypothetical protein
VSAASPVFADRYSSKVNDCIPLPNESFQSCWDFSDRCGDNRHCRRGLRSYSKAKNSGPSYIQHGVIGRRGGLGRGAPSPRVASLSRVKSGLIFLIFLVRLIELLFFSGVAGCVVTIVMSWYSIIMAIVSLSLGISIFASVSRPHFWLTGRAVQHVVTQAFLGCISLSKCFLPNLSSLWNQSTGVRRQDDLTPKAYRCLVTPSQKVVLGAMHKSSVFDAILASAALRSYQYDLR